jgi:hypothetical protein
MSRVCLRIAPQWWMTPACLTGMVVGSWFLFWPRGIFALGGGVLLLASIHRLFALQWVEVDEEVLRVSCLLRRQSHDWRRLTEVQSDSGHFRILFGDATIALPRREYARPALAKLNAAIQRRRESIGRTVEVNCWWS